MQTFEGIAVSPGVAIGPAFVIDNQRLRVRHRLVSADQVAGELARLDRAIAAVCQQMQSHRDAVADKLGDHYAAIFDAQLQMLADEQLQLKIQTLVRQQAFSAELAVSRTLDDYAEALEQLDSPYLAQRSHDIRDIQKRLIAELLGEQHEDLGRLDHPVVLVAHDLTPSEVAHLNRELVRGFATEIGGAGGHAAIVAEALEMPAVVGVGSLLDEVSSGELLIVDGDAGRVIVDPDDSTLAYYRREEEQHRSLAVHLQTLRDLPAETLDGQRVQLRANIEFPLEVEACLERGADGIGLYRTEFLYLDAMREPTEEDHYRAYAEVIRAMAGRPVVIRTLDLGADKMGREPEAPDERNPFLGLRSIRLSLRHLPSFRTQLRAILRASVLGDVRVMFPLIGTLQELRQARAVLLDLMEDLAEEGVEFDPQIPVGMMVEVPSAVTLADRFAREADFMSIGTNDLIQYALAVDRSNKEVASLYNASDPAVLRMIDAVVQAAQSQPIEVSLCGQMSASTVYTMLLLGLGLRCLSVPPAAIPEVKNLIRNVTMQQCRQVADRALSLENAMEITDFLKQELIKAVPDTAVH